MFLPFSLKTTQKTPVESIPPLVTRRQSFGGRIRERAGSWTSVKRWEKENEVLQAMLEDLANWITSTLPDESIMEETFFYALRDGVILCRLANLIQERLNPTSKIKYHPHERCCLDLSRFLCRDNVQNFLSWCRSMKIPDTVLFESNDCTEPEEQRDGQREIVICTMEVARRAEKLGMHAPKLVRMEKEIEMEEEQDELLSPSECDSGIFLNSRMSDFSQSLNNSTTLCLPKEETVSVILDSYLDSKVLNITQKYRITQIRKLKEGKYVILGKTMFTRMLNEHVLVRIGGGWDTLEHFISTHVGRYNSLTALSGSTPDFNSKIKIPPLKNLGDEIQKSITEVEQQISSHRRTSLRLGDSSPFSPKSPEFYTSSYRFEERLEDIKTEEITESSSNFFQNLYCSGENPNSSKPLSTMSAFPMDNLDRPDASAMSEKQGKASVTDAKLEGKSDQKIIEGEPKKSVSLSKAKGDHKDDGKLKPFSSGKKLFSLKPGGIAKSKDGKSDSSISKQEKNKADANISSVKKYITSKDTLDVAKKDDHAHKPDVASTTGSSPSVLPVSSTAKQTTQKKISNTMKGIKNIIKKPSPVSSTTNGSKRTTVDVVTLMAATKSSITTGQSGEKSAQAKSLTGSRLSHQRTVAVSQVNSAHSSDQANQSKQHDSHIPKPTKTKEKAGNTPTGVNSLSAPDKSTKLSFAGKLKAAREVGGLSPQRPPTATPKADSQTPPKSSTSSKSDTTENRPVVLKKPPEIRTMSTDKETSDEDISMLALAGSMDELTPSKASLEDLNISMTNSELESRCSMSLRTISEPSETDQRMFCSQSSFQADLSVDSNAHDSYWAQTEEDYDKEPRDGDSRLVEIFVDITCIGEKEEVVLVEPTKDTSKMLETGDANGLVPTSMQITGLSAELPVPSDASSLLDAPVHSDQSIRTAVLEFSETETNMTDDIEEDTSLLKRIVKSYTEIIKMAEKNISDHSDESNQTSILPTCDLTEQQDDSVPISDQPETIGVAVSNVGYLLQETVNPVDEVTFLSTPRDDPAWNEMTSQAEGLESQDSKNLVTTDTLSTLETTNVKGTDATVVYLMTTEDHTMSQQKDENVRRMGDMETININNFNTDIDVQTADNNVVDRKSIDPVDMGSPISLPLDDMSRYEVACQEANQEIRTPINTEAVDIPIVPEAITKNFLVQTTDGSVDGASLLDSPSSCDRIATCQTTSSEPAVEREVTVFTEILTAENARVEPMRENPRGGHDLNISVEMTTSESLSTEGWELHEQVLPGEQMHQPKDKITDENFTACKEMIPSHEISNSGSDDTLESRLRDSLACHPVAEFTPMDKEIFDCKTAMVDAVQSNPTQDQEGHLISSTSEQISFPPGSPLSEGGTEHLPEESSESLNDASTLKLACLTSSDYSPSDDSGTHILEVVHGTEELQTESTSSSVDKNELYHPPHTSSCVFLDFNSKDQDDRIHETSFEQSVIEMIKQTKVGLNLDTEAVHKIPDDQGTCSSHQESTKKSTSYSPEPIVDNTRRELPAELGQEDQSSLPSQEEHRTPLAIPGDPITDL